MKLIKEHVEQVECLVENTVSGKKVFIEGPFLTHSQTNQNGRIYEEKVLRPAVQKYIERYIKENRAMGELGHPASPSINLDRVSHLIEKLDFKEGTNWVIGKAVIIGTPMGQIAKNLIESGVKLGVSTRGLGSVKNVNGVNYVQNDFVLNTVDIVADPSGPGCFVEGIMESTDWKLVNGNWVESMSEVIVDAHKKKIDEAILLKEFTKLMKDIRG